MHHALLERDDGFRFEPFGGMILGRLDVGDVVDLATHKIAAVARLVEAAGATVRYLLAYSPVLNPIELVFAKLKAHLREAAARSLDDLIVALGSALRTFTSDHCRNFVRHANDATYELENALVLGTGAEQHDQSWRLLAVAALLRISVSIAGSA